MCLYVCYVHPNICIRVGVSPQQYRYWEFLKCSGENTIFFFSIESTGTVTVYSHSSTCHKVINNHVNKKTWCRMIISGLELKPWNSKGVLLLQRNTKTVQNVPSHSHISS